MPSTPSPILRVMEGLAERSGRVLVVSGPPLSGKSAVLDDLRARLRDREAHIYELRGSYRGRSTPFGALDGLAMERPASEDGSAGESVPGEVPIVELPAGPMAPGAYLPGRLPPSRRGRGERSRGGGLTGPVRARSANEGDPEAFWLRILPKLRGEAARPVALMIDDGALFDAESRDFILRLSQKARLRPLLIAVALDTSVAGYASWEEVLLGRADVDWIRFTHSSPDPREALRLKAIFDDLPSVTQKTVGFVALLGGSVGEVVLSRVARLNFPQLAEALLPATGVGLVKVTEGKVTFPHLPWISLTTELLPEKDRREMHLEIANALVALSPEPGLARRVEIAHHYLEWYPGPMALRELLDAAEVSLGLLGYDTSEELFREAIGCLAAVPPGERDPLEPEIRLLHAQSLFYAGRCDEAERELREGVEAALRSGTLAATLTEWIEPLILAMRGVGPRPSLVTGLIEIAERCHATNMVEVEVLLQALISEFYYERSQPEKARAESHRAATLARRLPSGPLHALALLAVAISRVDGSPAEQELAGRFLGASRLLFGRARRWELDHLAADLEARLLEVRGETTRARELRERAIPALQRAKLPVLELYQQLGVAELTLNRGSTKGVDLTLARARAIADGLHLLPPSPSLLRYWLLEGRRLAMGDATDEARDRWRALLDLPAPLAIPRLQAEATVRLALLEFGHGREDVARALQARLETPALQALLPAELRGLVPTLADAAPRSDHGGGPLPPKPPSERTTGRQDGKRPRR